MSAMTSEARFYEALKRIVAYMPPERLRRRCGHEYGLLYEEALEMAYENIQGEARAALRGYRRPRTTKTPRPGPPPAEGAPE